TTLVPRSLHDALPIFAACSNNNGNHNETKESPENSSSLSVKKIPRTEKKSENPDKTNGNETEEESSREESDILADYSIEEIEYVRVWLQMIDNNEIDELHVDHISAGEPINQYNDDSVNFPKDVIMLSGKIIAD